jgi:hypothetical protein
MYPLCMLASTYFLVGLGINLEVYPFDIFIVKLDTTRYKVNVFMQQTQLFIQYVHIHKLCIY